MWSLGSDHLPTTNRNDLDRVNRRPRVAALRTPSSELALPEARPTPYESRAAEITRSRCSRMHSRHGRRRSGPPPGCRLRPHRTQEAVGVRPSVQDMEVSHHNGQSEPGTKQRIGLRRGWADQLPCTEDQAAVRWL